VDEAQNEQEIRKELRNLCLTTCFATSFKRRHDVHGITPEWGKPASLATHQRDLIINCRVYLSDLQAKTEGAFIGEIISPLVDGKSPSLDSAGIQDDSPSEPSRFYPLPSQRRHFLALPFINIEPNSAEDGWVEHKWSGSDGIGYNPGQCCGEFIDTFAHHVLEESKGELLLADIQGRIHVSTRTQSPA
jgi:hypothetical protein